MKVLVVSQYFPPETGAPQARLSEFARRWSATGIDVTVLTGVPNHPTGIVHPGYERLLLRSESSDGYSIVRTAMYTTANEGIFRKTLSHLSFAASALLLGPFRIPRTDTVLVSSPQFFAIFSAWVIARFKRAHFIVEVRDLWPGIFVELGVLRNPVLIRILESMELFFYRRADHVVVVTDGFRQNIADRGIPMHKITTITNGVDTERFAPEPPARMPCCPLRQACGAPPGSTLVLYIGAHGISQGLETLLDAAADVADDDVHVCLIGDGAKRAELMLHAEALALTNVSFLSSVPRDDVNAYLNAADIGVVQLRDLPSFDTFIPSKLFEFMGSGMAVVAALRGEAAAIAADGGALVVPPGDAKALASSLRTLAADPEQRHVMGDHARSHVTTYYCRNALADRYVALFAETS